MWKHCQFTISNKLHAAHVIKQFTAVKIELSVLQWMINQSIKQHGMEMELVIRAVRDCVYLYFDTGCLNLTSD